MNHFDLNKKNALTKLDKSRKKGIDEDIRYLVDEINKKKDYFTTSSCSGRILIIAKWKRKDKCDWVFLSHTPVKQFSELKKAIVSALPKNKKNILFKQEAFIIHICCRTLSDAERLLLIGRKVNLKRSGIISTKKDKIMVEMVGNESMETIIAKRGKLLIEDPYLKVLLQEANKKLSIIKKKIKEFYKEIKHQTLQQ